MTSLGDAGRGTAVRSRLQLRTLGVLITSQIFGTVGATAGYTVGTLAAVALAGSATKAGVAQAAASLGTVGASVVLARITERRGRRAGLSLGYLIAAVGVALCVVAITAGDFLLLAAGGVLVSVASVTNFQARFAAADLDEDEAAKGISLVVWVSTIGSVAGPNVSAFGGRLGQSLDLSDWAGVYLVGGLGFVVAGVVLFAFLRPDPLLTARAGTGEPQPGEPVARGGFRAGAAAIRRSPRAVFALGSIAAGHTVMLAVMTWTPLHMQHGRDGLGAIGAVLSGHFLGMFAFAPVFGWTADRWGRVRVAALSAVLMLAALGTVGTAGPHAAAQLGVGLFLLGLAWCGMFVVGSGLLTDAVEPASRPAAQGLTDTAMWICSAVAVGAAGWIIQVGGYSWLAAVCVLPLVPVLALGIRLSSRSR